MTARTLIPAPGESWRAPRLFGRTVIGALAVPAVALTLAGCGGGSGGGGGGETPPDLPPPSESPAPANEAEAMPDPSPPPPPPPPSEPALPPPEPKFAETTAAQFSAHPAFQRQHGLVRAGAAYENHVAARGNHVLPGEGAVIGVVDTTIATDHPVFEPGRVERIGPEGFDLGSSSHGTGVTSVAAAGRGQMHGIAWGANVKFFTLRTGFAFNPVGQNEILAPVFRRVFDDGGHIDFLNLSFGFIHSFRVLFTERTPRQVEDVYEETIELLRDQRGRGEKAILVWAAGNRNGDACEQGPNCYHPTETDEDGGKRLCTAQEPCRDSEDDEIGELDAHSPDVAAGLMELFPGLRGHSVAVVSVDEEGVIAPTSNRCGEASERCIAAPGEDMDTAAIGDDDDFIVSRSSGTSFAAPVVTGALAVMKSAFTLGTPMMSNEELLERLFRTADKTGRYANEAIYGQGLVDLGAATRPVGAANIPAGAHATSSWIPVRETGISPGRAFGDGLTKALRGQRLVVFDSLGAPFPVRAAALVSGAPQAPGARLERVLRPQEDRESRTGRLSHARGLRRTTLFKRPGWRTSLLAYDGQVSGAALEGEGFTLTAFREEESLYGTRGEGAFGRISGSSLATGSARRWTRGAWTFELTGEAGVADPKWRSILVEDADTVWTSAFAAEVRRWLGKHSQAGLSLSQPLRVERASVDLNLPVAREPGTGRIVRAKRRVDLEPSGRQLDVEASFARRIGSEGLLRLELVRSHEPGHVRNAKPAWEAAAGLRLRW